MADWWMSDAEIALEYRQAANKVEQINIFAQLFCAPKKSVVDKLINIGCLTDDLFETIKKEQENKKFMAKDTLDIVREYYNKGYSDSAIATMTGMSIEMVTNRRRKMGLRSNNPSLGVDGIWRRHGDTSAGGTKR